MAHPFSSLSPDLVMSAIESVGIWPAGEPFTLNSYENRVLMFRDEEGERWVVKFYRPERWVDAAIQEEHDFLRELALAGVPVIAPWCSADGVSLHHYQTFRFSLFPQCAGQAPELDNPAHLFALGNVLGRLHDVAARQRFQHRESLSLTDGVTDAAQRVLASPHLDKYQSRAYQTVVEKLMEQLARVSLSPDAYLRAHGDCHLGNILGRDDDFTLVDFDDCLMAPAIQDVWMLLPVDDPELWRGQLDELIEGYEEVRAFPELELVLIEPLRAYRLIRHAAWLVSRWDDPAFPAAFPWVAERGYWDQHIRLLEQQSLQLESPVWLAGGNR